MNRSSHWFPIPYGMTSTMPPGRAPLEVTVRETVLLEFREIPSAPLAIEVRWKDGRHLEWRTSGGRLWRPSVDGKGRALRDVAAMQAEVAGSMRYPDYPLRYIHGKPMNLGNDRDSVLSWGGKVTFDGRGDAVRIAQEFVDDGMLLIGGVPHVEEKAPLWGLDVLDQYPTIRLVFPGRGAECQVTMPLDRRDELEILGRRLIDMLRDRKAVEYKDDLSIEQADVTIHLGLHPSHHGDLSRALDFMLRRVGDIPMCFFGGEFFDRVAAARAIARDDLGYSEGLGRLVDVLEAMPGKVSTSAMSDCRTMVDVLRVAAEFTEAPDADDAEALGMGLAP